MNNSKILLIDNNLQLSDQLIRALRDVFSFVEEARDLQSSESLLKSNEFDVVIYNTAVDENDGFDALARIRAFNAHASIISYSETPNINSVIEILKNGVFDYLTVPFDVNKLIDSVEKGIDNKKSFLEIVNLNKKLVENQETLESEKEELKKKNTKLETITNITKAMTGTLDLDEILHEIIYGIYNVFLFDRIFVSLIDYERCVEEAKVAMGLDDNIYDETIKSLSWDINDNKKNPWMNALIRGKNIVKIEDPHENKLYSASPIIKFHPATFIKVPLIAKGNVIGTLTIDNAVSNKQITDDEVKTLRVFADQAGIAIEKAKLYKNLSTAHDKLKEMQKKIIEAERLIAVSEIAVSVNHEINNPLCSLSLNAEILKGRLKDSDNAMIKKLDMIEKDIERIKDITSKLAKIQQVTTTKYSSDIKMLDIEQSTNPKEEA